MLARALLLALLTACQAEPRAGAPDGRRRVASAVALVNGEPVEAAELERLCRLTGWPPELALSRLVAERLLAQYAEQHGYGGLAAVRRASRQAAVRALLEREIERELPPEDVAGRRETLSRRLAELARATPVSYDETAIREAFARPEPTARE